MIVSYPLVNEDGAPNGGEVTFRFGSITAIQHHMKWSRERMAPTEPGDLIGERVEREVVIPNCVRISINRDEFNVQADYAELKAKLAQFNEWDEE